MKPITKDSQRIMKSVEVGIRFRELVALSLGDRKGPVLLDFPMDIQRAAAERMETTYQTAPNQKKSQHTHSNQVKRLALELLNSKQPLMYVGNGCRGKFEFPLLRDFIAKSGLPYALSWSALDLFPESDPLNVGRIGIYGDRATNIILQKSDILLCVGTRLAIPQIGYDKLDFGRNASKWIVEIDPTECAKFEGLGWNILNMPVEDFLIELSSELHAIVATNGWTGEIHRIKASFPRIGQVGAKPPSGSGHIHSAEVLSELNSCLSEDAVVSTDVGAALLNGHYIFEKRGTQRFFTSQGLGEMGFGLPGSIGAYFASPSRQIVCLNTDGALMFNLQELQVVRENKIPLKLFIFNNDGYSMIKLSQENLFAGRLTGSSIETGISFPSFEELAKVFGFDYLSVRSTDDFQAMHQALDSKHAVLIEVIMSPSQKYLPRLATSKLADGTLVSPPLEDLDPLLSIEELEKFLGYQPHANSYRARGLEYEKK
jgi:acetolactate synthase-1/2/3 large subunit